MVFPWFSYGFPTMPQLSPRPCLRASSLRRLRRAGPAATGSHGAAVGAAAAVAADAGGLWGRLGGEGAEELYNNSYRYITIHRS